MVLHIVRKFIFMSKRKEECMLRDYIKEIDIQNVHLRNNIFLAPMAGVTDIPFRKICRRFQPGLTFTEMASSKAMEYESKKTEKLL